MSSGSGSGGTRNPFRHICAHCRTSLLQDWHRLASGLAISPTSATEVICAASGIVLHAILVPMFALLVPYGAVINIMHKFKAISQAFVTMLRSVNVLAALPVLMALGMSSILCAAFGALCLPLLLLGWIARLLFPDSDSDSSWRRQYQGSGTLGGCAGLSGSEPVVHHPCYTAFSEFRSTLSDVGVDNGDFCVARVTQVLLCVLVFLPAGCLLTVFWPSGLGACALHHLFHIHLGNARILLQSHPDAAAGVMLLVLAYVFWSLPAFLVGSVFLLPGSIIAACREELGTAAGRPDAGGALILTFVIFAILKYMVVGEITSSWLLVLQTLNMALWACARCLLVERACFRKYLIVIEVLQVSFEAFFLDVAGVAYVLRSLRIVDKVAAALRALRIAQIASYLVVLSIYSHVICFRR